MARTDPETDKGKIRPLVVGLTGGIGSGKTTAADCFSALGVPVIDADAIARELVAPGQPAHADIIAAFGAGIVDKKGQIDRARLRQRVFANPAERRRLEAILHPEIYNRISALLSEIQAPYCILVIPLLLETAQTGRVGRLLVVDAPEESQLARAAARDGLSAQEIHAVMDTQVNRAQRLAAADDVLLNDSTPEVLGERVRALHEYYLGMSPPRAICE